ncbi:pyranose 2-oxidase [Colletotrichum liriopes]|uniref:Pyranose 2-oxidase n=1 Tax=Colletotrichum liriopes TaxID=708192 RepID=A0AA37GTH4_9PEZI|nr:pyranose 2-oxidase [Colletotrichum liriopes]
MGSMPPRERLDEVDVLIVGSGPIGAVFARKLVKSGRNVVMIDVGEQETKRIGDHKKNGIAVQKDISLFTKPCQQNFVLNGQNPNQKPHENLPAAAATRVVGGMGSHWTCCTPREDKTIERSTLFNDEQWDQLYTEAEELFWTNPKIFDDSIRQKLVKSILDKAFEKDNRKTASMPLCGKRREKNKDFTEWACTATILGDVADAENFKLLPNTQCVRFELDDSNKVRLVQVEDLLNNEKYMIKANKFVVCAGAVLTPGILWNSGKLRESLPALGRYLTEQPMSFCQIVLDRKHIDAIKDNTYELDAEEKKLVQEHKEKFPNDPLPFPYNDPDPQCYFPLTKEYPWHTQIHRDAFGYGQIPAGVDQRVIVDLRWFGYTKPNRDNRVEFSTEIKDGFGMPQPTFHFKIDQDDADRSRRMITDMVDVARCLGGFLPGAEPKYLPAGSALHICGTYRAGESQEDSVVDSVGRVWGQENLVLGGCGVIPTKNACNPTLTAGCFALAAAEQIIKDLEGVKAIKPHTI